MGQGWCQTLQRITGAVLLLLTMLAIPARAATTCNCGPPIAPVEAIRTASYAIEGVAVDKWMTLGPDFDRYSYVGRLTLMPIESYSFRVARGWKGYDREVVRLEQGYTFCDHHFAIGRRYLMLVTFHDSPAHLFASACFRLYEGAEIAAFAAQLGPPTVSFDLSDSAAARCRPDGAVACSRLSSQIARSIAGGRRLVERGAHSRSGPTAPRATEPPRSAPRGECSSHRSLRSRQASWRPRAAAGVVRRVFSPSRASSSS
jgi:hypothetical protein